MLHVRRSWSPLVTLTALVVMAGLGGCASDAMKASATWDPLARFPTQATYIWDDAASRMPDDPRLPVADTIALLKDVANEEFGKRGYRPVDSGPSNYRLTYELGIYTWTGPQESHAEGSLSLVIAETGSGRRVWTGFGQAQVLVGLTPEERRERLRLGLEEMLAEFPPAQRGSYD